MKSDKVYLAHIRDEIEFVANATLGITFEQFIADETLKRACVRSLEVIGEAVKNLSGEFKKRHTAIAWKQIAGMRDKLIHNYFGVDWRILWDAIGGKLPGLGREVRKLLDE